MFAKYLGNMTDAKILFGDTMAEEAAKETFLVRFESKKSAHSDINRLDMSTIVKRQSQGSHKGELKDLLQEIKQELDRAYHPENIHAKLVCVDVDVALQFMKEGEWQKAKNRLYETEYRILELKRVNPREYLEVLRESLGALDLGFFACSLQKYFPKMKTVIWRIWGAREELAPHLYDSAWVAWVFVNFGHKPYGENWALSVIAKLEEILSAYERRRGIRGKA